MALFFDSYVDKEALAADKEAERSIKEFHEAKDHYEAGLDLTEIERELLIRVGLPAPPTRTPMRSDRSTANDQASLAGNPDPTAPGMLVLRSDPNDEHALLRRQPGRAAHTSPQNRSTSFYLDPPFNSNRPVQRPVRGAGRPSLCPNPRL